jgi:beta-lactamase superfamily II metal-dependent hydrolase
MGYQIFVDKGRTELVSEAIPMFLFMFLILKWHQIVKKLFVILVFAVLVNCFGKKEIGGFLVVVFIFQLKNELPILRFKYLLAIFSVACLFYFVPPVWKTFFNRKGVDIQVLDIGQGDGLLLRVDGKKIAIDGGGPRLGARQLLPEIQKYFGGHIDLWVFSHFDQDHRGNFGEIEARLSIGKIWVPRLDGSTFSKMLRAQHRESLIIGQNELLEFSTEKHSWNCVSVNEAIAYVKVGNDDSLSCALSNRKTHDILFVSTGDLPSRLEPKVLDAFTQMGLKVPENGIMVLKLGHHGSKTSSSGIFLDGLRPQIGIITAGRQNQYRFPHEPVLERLLSRGVRVFRVDALGNFKVHFDN